MQDLCSNQLRVYCDGSTEQGSSHHLLVDFLIIDLATFTAASADPLVWGYPGLLVLCSKPHDFTNCLKSAEVNCGPLSVIRTSGIPCRAKCTFSLHITVNEFSFLRWSTDEIADFTIYMGTLSYMVSSPLGRIQSIFCSLCHSQFSIFSFHQVPITAGWTEAAWYERLTQHLYTLPPEWLEHWSPIQVLTWLCVA